MSRLNSHQSGKGPVLVMLHGLFGNLDNFRSVSLHLDRAATVIRMDLPGHGQSPSLPVLSVEAMAVAVLDEFDKLGIRSFNLLGHSLGGKVAMAIAASERCKGLQRLCIVDIAPKQYPPHHQPVFDALQSVDLNELPNRRDADRQLRDGIPDAGIRAFLLKSLYQHESKRYRWQFDLNQLAKDYPLISKPPELEHTIVVPTLFIKGGNSDYLAAGDEAVIKAAFEQPSLKVIANAGHWPHAEKPAQFTRICQDFFNSTSPEKEV